MYRVGVQLYTVRALMERDAAGTLERLAEAGYRNVETAGLHGHTPAAFARMLETAGLRTPSGHYGLDVLRGEERARTIVAAQALGQRYVVVPWLGEDERTSLDDYRRLADELNDLGSAAAEAGLQLAYHNHDFEFEPMDGQVPYDVLLESTDPELVRFELDLYWIVEGGYEPRAYFAAYPGRFPLWHLKDRTASGAMADVGAGTFDFEALLAHADQAGLDYAFVEHDDPAEPLASAQNSIQHLARLLD